MENEQIAEMDYSAWHMRKVFFAGKGAPFRNVRVDLPPNYGYAWCWIQVGERTSLVFSPTTFQSWILKNNSFEIWRAPVYEYKPETQVRILKANWDLWQKYNKATSADWMTAMAILEFLGEDPSGLRFNLKADRDETRKGGQETADVLPFKPVVRKQKRGQILEYLLGCPDNTGSTRQLMLKMETSRKNIQSNLWELANRHGITYELFGDKIQVMLPEGVTNPFTD